MMIDVREYVDSAGRSPFGRWFDLLNITAAAKVTTALERLASGQKGSLKSLGDGVSEYKIDFGPGYRIYFGREGQTVVILLAGGSKKQQARDINGVSTRLARKEIEWL